MRRLLGLLLVLGACGPETLSSPRDTGLPDSADAGSVDTGAPDSTRPDGALPDAGGDAPPTVSCPPGARAAFDAEVDALVASLSGDGVPGAAFVAVCGDETFMRTFGSTRAGGAAVDEHTLFQIASLTKTWTGLTAASMVDAGMLRLDTTVQSAFPGTRIGYPGDPSSPTLEQLLSHTGGYSPGAEGAVFGALETFATDAPDQRLLAPPGAVFNYANYGVTLGASIMVSASGRSFEQLVREHLLSPASMPDATISASEALATGNHAFGHSPSSGSAPIGPLDSYFQSPTYLPNGGGWASTTDLAAFARYLIGREYTGTPSTAISTPRTAAPDTSSEYGLGLFIDSKGSAPTWRHGGNSPGFVTSFHVLPSAGFAVAVMVNHDEFSAFLSDIFFNMLESTFTYRFGYADEPSAANMASWVGEYEDPVLLGNFQIRMSGASAEVVWSSGATSLIDSYAADVGELTLPGDPYPSTITFWREGGAVRYAVTSYSGVGVRR